MLSLKRTSGALIGNGVCSVWGTAVGKNDCPKSSILIVGAEFQSWFRCDAGFTTYFGMPGSRLFPSYLRICPISGFPSISMNCSSVRLPICGKVKARLRVWRSFQRKNFSIYFEKGAYLHVQYPFGAVHQARLDSVLQWLWQVSRVTCR